MPAITLRWLFIPTSVLPLAVLPCPAIAGSIAADSRITTVTVYRDRAIITREAAVQLAEGPQEFLFAGLPDGLDPDLVQVTGSGAAKVTILEVVAARAQLVAAANPRLRELQEQARALQAELQNLTDQSGVLQQQRDYLEKIKTLTTTMTNGDVAPTSDPAQWDKLLAFYAERQARLVTELRTLNRQREEVQERANTVQRQIKDLEGPTEQTVQNVIVRCAVASAGALTLQLSYTVQDARWRPTYDVRVASAAKSITLGYGAIVSQSTGEDWRDVRLVLSTAEPALGGTPPVFSTWFVQHRLPSTVYGAIVGARLSGGEKGEPLDYNTRTEASGVAGNFTGGAQVDKVQVVETSAATVASGLISATFTIPYAADVPADNAPHRVAIGTTSLVGVLNHVTLPKLGAHAYLRARVTNDADFPLIAGDVNLFLDGSFVAKSTMGTVMPGANFVLNLGVDHGIAVKRRLLNRLVENTGAFAKRHRITYDVALTVENNRPTGETIIVKDQVPISQHEKIVVTLVTPAKTEFVNDDEAGADGAVRRADDGTISWTVKLKPGEKRELPLKITVEHPADFPVFGLE